MKTFEDLNFSTHPLNSGKQAMMHFENGYGVSVIIGWFSRGGDGTYEVAILHNGNITYDTPITDDVLGYCSPDDVTDIMKQVQELPEK